MGQTEHRIVGVSGGRVDDFVALVLSGDYHEVTEARGEGLERLVVRVLGGEARVIHRTGGELDAVWMAPGGIVFAAAESHVVRLTPSTADPLAFAAANIDVPAWRVWGFDADHLYAWDPPVRITGATASAMPGLPGACASVHGLAPDRLFAAGEDFCCRWDGVDWIDLGGCDDPIDRIYAAPGDVLYACCPEMDTLYRCRGDDWELVDDLYAAADVAVWDGRLWIAPPTDVGLRVDGETAGEELGTGFHSLSSGRDLLAASDVAVIGAEPGGPLSLLLDVAGIAQIV